MKDKVKGLVLGLLIGVFLTGSLAYASGAQIEVYFKKIKIMIEGVEKTPTGQTFIYNNRAYVPVSFVSDILGKTITWEGDTKTVWIGSKGGKAVVASYGKVKVIKEELDRYLAVMRYFQPQYAQYEQDVSYQKFMLNHMIGFKILANAADAQTKKEMKDKTIAELDKVKFEIDSNVGSPTAFEAKLFELKLQEIDIYNYLSNILTATGAAEKQIADKAITDEYDTAMKADKNAYTSVVVSHILIALNNQDGTALRTKEEALARALEVQAKLKDGGDFAALAKEYSDDPGSKDNGGAYPDTPVTSWVPGFKEATVNLPIGTVSDPVETSFGYHIIKVTARTVKTMDEAKAAIRSRLAQVKLSDYFSKELPALVKDVNLPTPAPSPTPTPAP